MSEEYNLLDGIMKEIDSMFKPLELVAIYLNWKGIRDIKEELGQFIDSLSKKAISSMIDKCAEAGLINQDEDGMISLPKK